MTTTAAKLGLGSLLRVDPAGGSTYQTVVNQTNGVLNINLGTSDITTKSSSQWMEFLPSIRSWDGTIEGIRTSEPLLDLNGTDEYAHTLDHADFDFSTDITLQITIYPDSVSGTQTLIHKHDGTDGYILRLSNDEVQFVVDNSGATNSSTLTDAANLDTTRAHTIKAVFDGGTTTTKIYIDGTEFAATVTGTVPATCGVNATRVTIGADSANANLFDGQIGSAGLSNVGTLDGQFLQPNVSTTVAYYKFNGDSNDSSTGGSTHNLTDVNITTADYVDLTYYTLKNAILTKTQYTVQFYIDETTTPETYTGSATITSLSEVYPHGEAMVYNLAFEGTSTLTKANL